MRDWSKVAVGEGAGGTVVVTDVFAGGRVVLNDDKGGGRFVGGGEGGLARKRNGKGFIDLEIVEIGEGLEEVLVVCLWDCELATSLFPQSLVSSFFLTFFFLSFFGPLLIEGQGQFEGGEGRGVQGCRQVRKGYFRHTALF